MDRSTLANYTREEIVESLLKIRDEYPAVFKHFFMWEIEKRPIHLSKEDLELLK
jgi:hypothetical protein